jgi:2-polyprenyl-3-methyl-5-hydroxy-6-metoxy-1,4-benzoquinol methylase
MADWEDASTRSWNAAADDWVAHADVNDYRNLYLMPRMLARVGDVAGKRVLDLGCGEGGYSRELHRRGASVIGIDGSERLIEVARQRSPAAVVFLCTNAAALDDVETGSIDVIVAAMSLMDVEDYPSAIGEANRVLRRGGRLHMSITHPCFSAPISQWVRDENGELQHFAVDRYFERVAWESQVAPPFRTTVLRRHRPLEDYLAVPLEQQFVLRDFSEPSVTADELRLSRRFRKLLRIPYFLFLTWEAT